MDNSEQHHDLYNAFEEKIRDIQNSLKLLMGEPVKEVVILNRIADHIEPLFDIYRCQRMRCLDLQKKASRPIVIEGTLPVQDIRHPTAEWAIFYDYDIEGTEEEDLFMKDDGTMVHRALIEVKP